MPRKRRGKPLIRLWRLVAVWMCRASGAITAASARFTLFTSSFGRVRLRVAPPRSAATGTAATLRHCSAVNSSMLENQS